MKLALGTVQFGIPYGIANQTGILYDATTLATQQAARDQGHECLDTSNLNARLFERAKQHGALVLNARLAPAHRHREIDERWLHEHPPITKAVFISILWPVA